MDVSDTKLILEIYRIISGIGSSRKEQSIDQFKVQLIALLRKNGYKILIVDENNRLYLLNGKIIFYFSPPLEKISNMKRFLIRILKESDPHFIIAYGIRNETGACIYRVEIPE